MTRELTALPDADVFFEGAPCALVVTRENGTVLRANATFCSWIGYSEAQLLGQRFQNLLTMGGKIFHQTHWAPLMQMQGSVAEVKLDLVHRDRHTVTMLLNGVRRVHAGDVFHELALFGTTDRDKYERELLHARKLAELLLAQKASAESALQDARDKLQAAYQNAQHRASFAEQMMAIVSHDLRNPLTAITMAAAILGRGERTGKEAQLLGHISQSADRAGRMISDLLDLALVRVGQGMVVNRTPVDLQHLARRCVDELQVVFPGATLRLDAHGDGLVNLDADRIQQVIGNLVGNAAAYGDTRQPIVVTSRIDADSATLCVHNFGEPIPETALPTLFEPMTRGVPQTGEVRSIGLGLFIVQAITAAHGAEIGVRSTAGHGTLFTVTFPRH